MSVGAWIKHIGHQKYLACDLNRRETDTRVLGFDAGLVGEPRTCGADLTYKF